MDLPVKLLAVAAVIEPLGHTTVVGALREAAAEITRLRELNSLATIECEDCGESATRVVSGWAYCDRHDGTEDDDMPTADDVRGIMAEH